MYRRESTEWSKDATAVVNQGHSLIMEDIYKQSITAHNVIKIRSSVLSNIKLYKNITKIGEHITPEL